MVGRGDQHRVDRLGLQQFPVIAEALGPNGLLLDLVDLCPIDIANSGNIHLLAALEHGHDVFAAVAAANQAELNAVIGAHHAHIAGGRHGGCASNQGTAVHRGKISSRSGL